MSRGPMGPLEQKCCNSEVRSEGGGACPKGLWAKFEDTFGCPTWGMPLPSSGNRSAAHRTAPTAKNDPAQNVQSAEVERG